METTIKQSVELTLKHYVTLIESAKSKSELLTLKTYFDFFITFPMNSDTIDKCFFLKLLSIEVNKTLVHKILDCTDLTFSEFLDLSKNMVPFQSYCLKNGLILSDFSVEKTRVTDIEVNGFFVRLTREKIMIKYIVTNIEVFEKKPSTWIPLFTTIH